MGRVAVLVVLLLALLGVAAADDHQEIVDVLSTLGLKHHARRDSAEHERPYFTTMAWIFIPAYACQSLTGACLYSGGDRLNEGPSCPS